MTMDEITLIVAVIVILIMILINFLKLIIEIRMGDKKFY